MALAAPRDQYEQQAAIDDPLRHKNGRKVGEADIDAICYSCAMNERYEPASDFLKAVIAEEVPLRGSEFADANLRQLIGMTRDPDLSNRDWATLLLAQLDGDGPHIRAALLAASRDESHVVRAEALLGLAQRDKALALPLAIEALSGPMAVMAVFEAAEIIADRSLVEYLRPWVEPSDNAWLDKCANDAMKACQEGFPRS